MKGVFTWMHEAEQERKRLVSRAFQGPPREAYTTREPEEFDREASANTEDRESTEERYGQ